MSDVENQVRGFLIEELTKDKPDAVVTDSTDLLDEDLIDSLGIMLLVDRIQERFGVELDPEDMVMDNFQSLPSLTTLVTDKLMSSPGAQAS